MTHARNHRKSAHVPAVLGREETQAEGKEKTAKVELRLGASVVDMAPKVITAVRVSVVAKGEGRRAVRFFNSGAAAIFLGGSGVTSANSAIKIPGGEGWTEDDAPDAEWFAICASGNQSTLRVQILQ